MRHLAGACLLALSSLAATAAPATGELNGSYALVDTPKHAEDVVRRAVDDATGSMSIFTRGTARRRLRKKNEVPRRIDVTVTSDKITVVFDRERTYTTPADGRGVPIDLPDGEHVTLSQKVRDGRVVQTFEAKDGMRRNIIEPQADGGMRFMVSVASGRLPESVHYRIDYKRL